MSGTVLLYGGTSYVGQYLLRSLLIPDQIALITRETTLAAGVLASYFSSFSPFSEMPATPPMPTTYSVIPLRFNAAVAWSTFGIAVFVVAIGDQHDGFPAAVAGQLTRGWLRASRIAVPPLGRIARSASSTVARSVVGPVTELIVRENGATTISSAAPSGVEQPRRCGADGIDSHRHALAAVHQQCEQRRIAVLAT